MNPQKLNNKYNFRCLDKFLRVHIKHQIDSGAEVIQVFDSWAGLLENENLSKYI